VTPQQPEREALEELRRAWPDMIPGFAARQFVIVEKALAQVEQLTRERDKAISSGYDIIEALITRAEQAKRQRDELRELLRGLWKCPKGHITNNPSPIPGRGDTLGDCPYPCHRRMKPLAALVSTRRRHE
jgi:hypothetical protein